jgi:predicted secreted protein
MDDVWDNEDTSGTPQHLVGASGKPGEITREQPRGKWKTCWTAMGNWPIAIQGKGPTAGCGEDLLHFGPSS